MTDNQYNTLNSAYNSAWRTYQSGLNQLTNVPEAQRAQQMQQLQNQFNESVSNSANQVFTDPQQRARYNQLYMQYQGYGAFNDPTLQQKLNLTDAQRRQLTQYGNEWNQQMSTLSNEFQRDPTGTSERYNQLLRSRGDRINSILNPQQQQTWQQMTGSTYNFPANTYFQSGGTTGTNGTNNPGTGGTSNNSGGTQSK